MHEEILAIISRSNYGGTTLAAGNSGSFGRIKLLPGISRKTKMYINSMNAFFCILLLIAFYTRAFSQHEHLKATMETMASTFNLQADTLTGTCFMVTKGGKQYFVTAAHLFKVSHKSGDVVPVQMVVQNQREPFDATVYFHEDRNIDIAVIKLSEKVSQSVELLEKVAQGDGISLDTTLLSFGMQVFFYGFPLRSMGTEGFGIKFPLLKRAIVSGVVKYNGVDVIVLDGHNNSGFSGGPVLAYDTSINKMCIVGVISGYFPETRSVQYKGDRLSFDENSGIILCYSRRHIEEIFNTNKKHLY